MSKIKDAIKRWEEASGEKAAEAEHVKLNGVLPPIEKMDATLGTLSKCRHLSLSTNSIDKISGLSGLQNLEILSLGRNNIKSLAGIEAVAGTLRELWISYNNIDKLSGILPCKRLKVLYMSNNKVEKWSEFDKLKDIPELEDILLVGNPLEQAASADGKWVTEVKNRLPKLKKLDGKDKKMRFSGASAEPSLHAGGPNFDYSVLQHQH